VAAGKGVRHLPGRLAGSAGAGSACGLSLYRGQHRRGHPGQEAGRCGYDHPSDPAHSGLRPLRQPDQSGGDCLPVQECGKRQRQGGLQESDNKYQPGDAPGRGP